MCKKEEGVSMNMWLILFRISCAIISFVVIFFLIKKTDKNREFSNKKIVLATTITWVFCILITVVIKIFDL